MNSSFQKTCIIKTCIFVLLTTMVGVLPCLALDNMEPSIELQRAENIELVLDTNVVSNEKLTTELLSILCPRGNAQGSIDYSLATAQQVALCVYDKQGKEIINLVDRTIPSGRHCAVWDGCREDGQPVQDGTYFLMLKTDDSVELHRMVLAR